MRVLETKVNDVPKEKQQSGVRYHSERHELVLTVRPRLNPMEVSREESFADVAYKWSLRRGLSPKPGYEETVRSESGSTVLNQHRSDRTRGPCACIGIQ